MISGYIRRKAIAYLRQQLDDMAVYLLLLLSRLY